MKLRIRHIPVLYHIGSMQPRDRTRGSASKGLSQEGNALSWSPCPSAWQRIAKLGGRKLFQIHNKQGRFVDIIATLRDRTAQSAVREWAIDSGYAKPKRIAKLWTYDIEAEEWRYWLCNTPKEAAYEAGEKISKIPTWGGPETADEARPAIEQVEILNGTSSLFELTGLCDPKKDTEDALQACLVGYALKTSLSGSGIDGFYFDEVFDPDLLSAPRGGLFQHSLRAWNLKEIGWSKAPDINDFDPASFVAKPGSIRVDPPVEDPIAFHPPRRSLIPEFH